MKELRESMHGVDEKMHLRIGVLGPGAVGGLLAAILRRDGHQVVCVGRETTNSKLKSEGISVVSKEFGDFKVFPEVNREFIEPLDILFVTVKSPFLHAAIEKVRPAAVTNAVVIPLLNGIGHAHHIRSRLGNKVATGTIGSVEVIFNSDRVVCHRSEGRPHIELASDSDVPLSQLNSIAQVLESSGISVSLFDKESVVVWRKLVRLSAIASLTSAYQCTLGSIRDDEHKYKSLVRVVHEGVKVAETQGAHIEPYQVLQKIDSLSAHLTTSLQRDLKNGKPSELDAIVGSVISIGKRYGVPVVEYEKIYRRILRTNGIKDKLVSVFE